MHCLILYKYCFGTIMLIPLGSRYVSLTRLTSRCLCVCLGHRREWTERGCSAHRSLSATQLSYKTTSSTRRCHLKRDSTTVSLFSFTVINTCYYTILPSLKALSEQLIEVKYNANMLCKSYRKN